MFVSMLSFFCKKAQVYTDSRATACASDKGQPAFFLFRKSSRHASWTTQPQAFSFMSAFTSFRVAKQISTSSESSDDAAAAHAQKKSKAGPLFAEDKVAEEAVAAVKSEEPAAVNSNPFAASSDATFEDLFCAPSFNRMEMQQRAPTKSTAEPFTETEDHDYVREHCLKRSTDLKTFDEIVGVPHVVAFAQQYEPVVTGARRAISGLLLFGPSGTGKTASAQAITSFINGTFYQFSAANLPSNFAKQANRIDALFEVAMSGPLPAVIFLDEVDTFLSARATARVGHFATKFERFTNNLLVIGATNEPKNTKPLRWETPAVFNQGRG